MNTEVSILIRMTSAGGDYDVRMSAYTVHARVRIGGQ